MKHTRKLLSLALIAAAVCSLSVSAHAADYSFTTEAPADYYGSTSYDPLDPTGASGELIPSPEDTGFFSVSEEEQLLLFGCSNGRIFYVQVRHLTSLQAIGRHDSHSLHDAEHASAEIHRLHNRSPPGLHTRRIFFSPLRFLVGSRHHRHLRVLDDKNRLFFVQPKRPAERGVSAPRRHPRLRAELQLHQRPQRAGNTIPPMRSRFWRSTRAFVSFPRGDWK